MKDKDLRALRREMRSRRHYSYYCQHCYYLLRGCDIYKQIALAMNKIFPVKGKKVLDVASGVHCLMSYYLSNLGAEVTAMDPLANPQKVGFEVRKDWFRKTTTLKEFDLVVSFNSEQALDSILTACQMQKTPAIIIASNRYYELGECEVDCETYIQHMEEKHKIKEQSFTIPEIGKTFAFILLN